MKALWLCAALVLVAWPAVAWAQEEPAAPPGGNVALAEVLFQEAKTLLDAGDIPAACRKLEQSYQLDPLPGALLNLAVCHEREGKTATAWAEFHTALSLAKSDGRTDRQALAEERIAALSARMSRVTVRLPPALPPGFSVLIAGRAIPSSSWGSAVPVDPGSVSIRAEAIEHEPFEQALTVKEQDSLELVIPPLTPVIKAPPKIEFIELTQQPPPPKPKRPMGPWQIAGYSAIGVGGATALAGLVTGVYALSEESAADKDCGVTTCPDAASLQRSNNANAAATVTNVLVPVGATLAGAGLTVVLVTTFTGDQPTQAALTLGGTLW